MSKILRTFFLSVLVVILAVSFAFADASIALNESFKTYPGGEEAKPGETVVLKFTLSDDDDEAEPATVMLEDLPVNIGSCDIVWSLDISEDVDTSSTKKTPKADISWLHIYKIEDDPASIIVAGMIPEEDYEEDGYSLVVTANVQYTYEAMGGSKTVKGEFGLGDSPHKIKIAEDDEDDGETKTVEPESSVSTSKPYLTSNGDAATVSEKYEAHLMIPTATVLDKTVLAAYIPVDAKGKTVTLTDGYASEEDGSGDSEAGESGEIETATIFLPPWLDYEVVSYDEITVEVEGEGNDDSSTEPCVTDLRIFYSPDAPYKPDDGVEAIVKITGVYGLNASQTGISTDNVCEIAWKVTVSNSGIILASSDVSLALDFGETASAEVAYTGTAPVSYKISDDASSDIANSALGLTVASDDKAITLTVTPTGYGSYLGTITFADADGSEAALTLSVDITSKIAVSGDTVAIEAGIGKTSSATVNILGAALASYEVSPDVPETFAFTETASTDSTITFSITPTASGDYSGTLTVYDANENSADVALTLKATTEGTFTIALGRSSVSVERGKSADVTVSATNAVGVITWMGTATSGSGLTVTFSPDKSEATSTTVTITAGDTAASGDVSIYASTASGDVSNTVTLSVNVTVPVEPEPEPEHIDTEDIEKLNDTTKANMARISRLRAGGNFSGKISIAGLGLTADPTSWKLLIGALLFRPAGTEVYGTAADWDAELTNPTTEDVDVAINVPDTVANDTDVSLVFDATDGETYELPLGTIAKSTKASGGVGSSSGGCEAGFGALALVLAAPLFLRRKRS